MKYCKNRAINDLVTGLVRLGCRLDRNNHLKITAPNGQVVTLPRTPSDHRAERNAERDVRNFRRRAGFFTGGAEP
jgi:hypothetical protein